MNKEIEKEFDEKCTKDSAENGFLEYDEISVNDDYEYGLVGIDKNTLKSFIDKNFISRKEVEEMITDIIVKIGYLEENESSALISGEDVKELLSALKKRINE